MAPVPHLLPGRALVAGEHYWPVTVDQGERLAHLLNVEFSELGVRGAYIMSPQLTCKHCGKVSGLDDIVFEALQLGIHTPEFIVEDLKEGGRNPHSGSAIRCMNCGNHYTNWKRSVDVSGADEWVRGESGAVEEGPAGEVGSAVSRWGGKWVDVDSHDSEATKPEGPHETAEEPAEIFWGSIWVHRPPPARDAEAGEVVGVGSVEVEEPKTDLGWNGIWIHNPPRGNARDAEAGETVGVESVEDEEANVELWWTGIWIHNPPRGEDPSQAT